MKNFFKGKVIKWVASSVVTCVLIYVGVPAPVATQVGGVVGEQAEELID